MNSIFTLCLICHLVGITQQATQQSGTPWYTGHWIMVVGGVLSIYITFNGMKSGKVEYKFEVGTTGGFAELRRFTVEGNSITDDSNTQVKGMYNDDGIISWYEGSNLVATWKRNEGGGTTSTIATTTSTTSTTTRSTTTSTPPATTASTTTPTTTTDQGYEIRLDSYCEPDRGRFQTLSEAKQQCTDDLSCSMVFDHDGKHNDFRLCDKGATIILSTHGSLLHMKIFEDQGYEIRLDSYCEPDRGRFQILSEAKQQCTDDLSCAMVFDHDGKHNDFRLCDKGATIILSTHGSLLHMKIFEGERSTETTGNGSTTHCTTIVFVIFLSFGRIIMTE